MSDIIIPSSPEDKKKLKLMLQEMTQHLQKIAMEREANKDIANVIKEQFAIPTKFTNKLAKTLHNHNFDNVRQEHDDFETLYESLVRSKAVEE